VSDSLEYRQPSTKCNLWLGVGPCHTCGDYGLLVAVRHNPTGTICVRCIECFSIYDSFDDYRNNRPSQIESAWREQHKGDADRFFEYEPGLMGHPTFDQVDVAGITAQFTCYCGEGGPYTTAEGEHIIDDPYESI